MCSRNTMSISMIKSELIFEQSHEAQSSLWQFCKLPVDFYHQQSDMSGLI